MVLIARHTDRMGFTLAELLIALAILGVIATFTIPKVLQAQGDSKNKAIVKEAASMLSGAYQAFRIENSKTYAGPLDITPYMNYVRVKTVGLVDVEPGYGTDNCDGSTGAYCLQLHNGATLLYWGDTFCQTSNPTAFKMIIDPDGVGDGHIEGIGLWLYDNGLLRTTASVEADTEWGWGSSTCQVSAGPDPSMDPDWFSWN